MLKNFFFFLWLEGRWNQHLLKGFFSCQGKKPQLSQSQLWLWIIKYSTDTAAGNNGAAGQERLQRPQEEEDLTVQRFSFYKRRLSLQLVRQGQGWRGAIQPSFALRAALNQKPCGYSSSPSKLLTCPVKLCSPALLKWDWRQTCKRSDISLLSFGCFWETEESLNDWWHSIRRKKVFWLGKKSSLPPPKPELIHVKRNMKS